MANKFKATFTYRSTTPADDTGAWLEALSDMRKLREAGFQVTDLMSATTPDEITITFGVW